MDKDDHYLRHGGDFGGSSADDYEAMAIAFLSGPLAATMVECFRASGDRIRFDKATQAFAVCDKGGNLRTFFKPSRIIHRRKSNLDYFKAECGK